MRKKFLGNIGAHVMSGRKCYKTLSNPGSVALAHQAEIKVGTCKKNVQM